MIKMFLYTASYQCSDGEQIDVMGGIEAESKEDALIQLKSKESESCLRPVSVLENLKFFTRDELKGRS